MKILGLSAFYHESACCLLVDGRLVAAAAEERFSRLKHDSRLPVAAFRHCLRAGGLGVDELDAVAYYEEPVRKLGRQLWTGLTPQGPPDLPWLDPLQPRRAIRERLGYEGPIVEFPHHLSHAASAYYFSGFPEAAVFTADGVGEWATTTYGRGQGPELEIFEEVRFPHSLGLLYSAFTAYLGFAVNDGEYKVMGLAPYGEPRFADQVANLLRTADDGRYVLDMRYFGFLDSLRMDSPRLEELLGQPARRAGEPLTSFHRDVARSVQWVVEEILLQKIEYLHRRTGSKHLCMAGGVALNCVANGRIRREGPFEHLFVQPAAGDAGTCLGAAALAHRQLTGEAPSSEPLRHAFYGPMWPADAVAALLAATDLPFEDFRRRPAELLEAVVDLLTGPAVVGWFQGAMEFGPRALGARSILANPLDPEARDRLNEKIKKRESFRPFAPSVLEERAAEHFDLGHASPFMLETCAVRSPFALPAITHVDGSARPQTVSAATAPRFAALLEAFFLRTGCPLLVNTSFNVAGEPIVCTPEDALFCFVEAGLDALVVEDFLLLREELPAPWVEQIRAWRRPRRPARFGPAESGPDAASTGAATPKTLGENLYTFV
jgi:carbamoyltransferase